MNFSKLILLVIFTVITSLSTLTVSFAEPHSNVQFVSMAPANYYVYLYIDDVLWRYEYDEDGKLIHAEIVDIG